MFITSVALILLLSPVPLSAGGSSIPVDCDAGDRLENALRRAEESGDGRIRLSGTCRGNYTFSGRRLSIGAAAPGATIQGRDGLAPVLEIRGGDSVVLNGLRLVDGGVGVWATRTDFLSVIDTEFKGNQVGLYLEKGTDAFISESRLVNNVEGGLALRTGSSASVVNSEIRANGRIGVSLLESAGVALVDSEVSGHTSTGVEASIQCWVNLIRSTFSENGEAHAVARDFSSINMVSEVLLGSPGDTTQIGAFVDDQAALSGFSTSEIHGDIFVSDAAYADFGSIDLYGDLLVSDFGRLNLFRTDVDGMIRCLTGGDAVCTRTMSILTEGCSSAPADCANPPLDPAAGAEGAAPVAPPRTPERFRVEREPVGGETIRPENAAPTRGLERTP